MKKFFLLSLIFFCAGYLKAQDIIIMKKGAQIQAKIIEITNNDVRYKRFNNLEGPTLTTAKTEIIMVRYQDGRKLSFEVPVAAPVPVAPVVPPSIGTEQGNNATEGKKLSDKEEMEAKAKLLKQQLEEDEKKEAETIAQKQQDENLKKAQEQEKQKKAEEEAKRGASKEEAKPKTEPDQMAAAKKELDDKTKSAEDKSGKRPLDFPKELEIYGGILNCVISTDQYKFLKSYNGISGQNEDAFKGSNRLLSTSFGLNLKNQIVSFWYYQIGISYNQYSLENEFSSTLKTDTLYKNRFYKNQITTVGIPVGFVFFLGNKNRGKGYLEGGMLTQITISETDELYPVLYDKPATDALMNANTFHFNPYAGGGIRFKLGNRGRVNLGAQYLFPTMGNLSNIDGVKKSIDNGLLVKLGLGIGIGSNE